MNLLYQPFEKRAIMGALRVGMRQAGNAGAKQSIPSPTTATAQPSWLTKMQQTIPDAGKTNPAVQQLQPWQVPGSGGLVRPPTNPGYLVPGQPTPPGGHSFPNQWNQAGSTQQNIMESMVAHHHRMQARNAKQQRDHAYNTLSDRNHSRQYQSAQVALDNANYRAQQVQNKFRGIDTTQAGPGGHSYSPFSALRGKPLVQQ